MTRVLNTNKPTKPTTIKLKPTTTLVFMRLRLSYTFRWEVYIAKKLLEVQEKTQEAKEVEEEGEER